MAGTHSRPFHTHTSPADYIHQTAVFWRFSLAAEPQAQECRADHIVPRGGPSQFPNNLTIIGFLELPPLGEGRLARCSHCDNLLCDPCKRAHMDQVRADVNRLVSQVRRALPQITEQINMIGRKGAQLQNRCESVKNEISEAIEKHIRELKSRERLMREDVDNFLVGELRGLRTHQENLEVELASMASFCDSTESNLSRSRHMTDGDLVELKRQCVEHMGTLRDYETGTLRPPVPRNIQLSAESQFLTSTISNFGDLIITSGSSTIQGLGLAASRTLGRQPGVPERRTTMRAPETATDYALSSADEK
nr:hypothetical protein BaRGS_029221 [Batillaria attramentaria]